MAKQQRKEEQNQGRGQSGGKGGQDAEPTRGQGGGGGQQRGGGATQQRGGGSQVTESGRFQNMSIEELRKEAKNKNIKNPENQSKEELVRKLQDAEERRE
ncbi:MAG: hypothetical protein KY455_00660 [Euryarchaeota archaeon]|nr:hypothetical protein [Euryarchaeota archaeon]